MKLITICKRCGSLHQLMPVAYGRSNTFSSIPTRRSSIRLLTSSTTNDNVDVHNQNQTGAPQALSPSPRTPFQSDLSPWQPVVGLEIHAQIQSESKLFSGAGAVYGGSTNSQVTFFDASLPGTLPVLNKRCVEAGVLTSLALGCTINTVSKFDRKHYFYADMPAGYQITQQRQPLSVDGALTYASHCSRSNRMERRRARLLQVQLEQDSGKSLHDGDQGLSLIDLNRAGMGLMEIVTAPDFTSGDEAASFAKDLRDLLVTIGANDGKMAEGSLRVDANISVHKAGQELGVRTEIKNLNSFRSLRLAVDYEIDRQTKLLESGGTVLNETRSFDLESGETVPMRDKEKLLDYRFMPEPNLPPLVIHTSRPDRSGQPGTIETEAEASCQVVLEDLRGQLVELPEQARHRLETDFSQNLTNAVILVRSGLSPLFESLVSNHKHSPDSASYVVRNCVIPLLQAHRVSWAHSPVSEKSVSELTGLFENGLVSAASLAQLMEVMCSHPSTSVRSLVEEMGLWKTTDTSLILEAVDGVLDRNPRIIKSYKKGKVNQLAILTSKVLKQLDNKADTRTIREMIKDKLHD